MAKDGIVTLQLTVSYDRKQFDEDAICEAVDRVLQNALETPGVLDEVGNPSVGSFEVAIGDDVHLDDDEEEADDES